MKILIPEALTLTLTLEREREFHFSIYYKNNLQLISTAAVDMNCTLPILLVFDPVGHTNNCEVPISSNSFVSIPPAQTLQQDPSAFWRDRIIDCLCCVLTVCVDTIWYTASCTKSVHFSASLIELTLKSANVVNADDAGANIVNADDAGANFENADAGAFN